MSNGLSIAIMNAKGGVGKSTLTMALAEALVVHHRRRVLVIDSDGQVSVSLMLLPIARLQALRDSDATLVDIISQSVLQRQAVNWRSAAAPQASDLEDAQELFIVPGSMDLTLVEREITSRQLDGDLRSLIRHWLSDAKTPLRCHFGRLRARYFRADRVLVARMRSPYCSRKTGSAGRRRHGISQELQAEPCLRRICQSSRCRHQHARSRTRKWSAPCTRRSCSGRICAASSMPFRICSICKRPASIRPKGVPSCPSIPGPPGRASKVSRTRCWPVCPKAWRSSPRHSSTIRLSRRQRSLAARMGTVTGAAGPV